MQLILGVYHLLVACVSLPKICQGISHFQCVYDLRDLLLFCVIYSSSFSLPYGEH